MALRDTIKSYFETADIPTQAQFYQWLDGVTFLEELNAEVLSQPLTGFTPASGTVTASDTILEAFQKLYAGAGTVTGSGTQNYVAKWNNGGGTAVGNSLIFDNGTSVAIGNASPTASTAFEVNSTTGGFLFPRMTSAQKSALTAIAGMTVFDSDQSTYAGYAAGDWYNFMGTKTTNNTNYYPKFVSSSVITEGLIFDNGTSVAIGNATPTASTLFELKSTTAALLLTRQTTAEWAALTKIPGMIGYNSTKNLFNIYTNYTGGATEQILTNLNDGTGGTYSRWATGNQLADANLSDNGTNIFVKQNIKLGSHSGVAYIDFASAGDEFNIYRDPNYFLKLNATNNKLSWDLGGGTESSITQSSTGTIIYSALETELSGVLVKVSAPFRITSGSPGLGKVWTSTNGAGDGSWQDPETELDLYLVTTFRTLTNN